MNQSEIRIEFNANSFKSFLLGLPHKLFGIDYRAIKVFRISMGLIILTDLLLKLPYAEAFFTDKGILPRNLYLTYQDFGRFSIHLASGELWWQWLLMFIAAVFAVMLILNIKPRIAAAASLFLLLSIQARNPLITQGGDVLFRTLLFWAMFLPYEYNPSALNSTRGGSKAERVKTLVTVATAGILIQASLIFIFAGILKTGAPWVTTYTATWDAMQIKLLTTPIGDFISSLGALTKIPTMLVPYIELYGGLLLFFPLFTKYVRVFAVVLLSGLIINFGLALWIDLFPEIVIAGLILFLPTFVWDYLEIQFNRFMNWLRGKLPKQLYFDKTLLATIRKYQNTNVPFRIKSKLGHGLLSFVLLLAIVLSVWWNIASIPGNISAPFPETFRQPMIKIGLDQYWGMFAPFPANVHGWYVLAGELPGGAVVDILNNKVGELNWDNKVWFSGQPWKKFAVDYLAQSNSSYLLQPFASLVCNQWKKNTGQPLTKLTIYFMQVRTLPDFKLSEPERKTLWTGNCV